MDSTTKTPTTNKLTGLQRLHLGRAFEAATLGYDAFRNGRGYRHEGWVRTANPLRGPEFEHDRLARVLEIRDAYRWAARRIFRNLGLSFRGVGHFILDGHGKAAW